MTEERQEEQQEEQEVEAPAPAPPAWWFLQDISSCRPTDSEGQTVRLLGHAGVSSEPELQQQMDAGFC